MPATPGTSTKVVISPAIGNASSETYDPFFPIEAGRTYDDGEGEDTVSLSSKTTKGK